MYMRNAMNVHTYNAQTLSLFRRRRTGLGKISKRGGKNGDLWASTTRNYVSAMNEYTYVDMQTYPPKPQARFPQDIIQGELFGKLLAENSNHSITFP